MSKLYLSAIMLAGFVVGLQLTGPVEAHPRHGEGRERIADRLELTAEQRQALAEARAAHREALAEASQRMREAYADILTDEQLAILRESRAGMRGARIERMVERLGRELELHVSQEVLVREALADTMSEVRPKPRMRGNLAGGDRAALHQERQEAQAELRDRLSEILTPAQLERYDELRVEQRRMHRRRDRN